MIRLSASQAALFFDPARGKPRTRKPAGWLPENIVEKQVTDFLRAKGWTVTRQQSGLFAPAYDAQKRVRIGEKGCCDWRVERALHRPSDPFLHQLWYLEVKAPGKRPGPHQKLWIDRRTKTGTPALWVDSLEMLTKWYRENFG